MRKKIGVLLVLTFIVSMVIVIILVRSNKQESSEFGSSIAIMVYDEEKNDYVKSNTIPQGDYTLNRVKTTCKSGGFIYGYNFDSGTIKYNFNTSDECNLYFDVLPTLARYIKSLYTGQGTEVGDGVLFFENEEDFINDNSYRYAGANPDNYVCFDGDDCINEDNLYRIIGVIDNKVKLIKYTSVGKKYWGNEDANWENSDLYHWLNDEYFETLSYNVSNLIVDSTWSIGGMNKNASNVPFSNIFSEELDYSSTVNAKIGLMYISDFYGSISGGSTYAFTSDAAGSNYNYWAFGIDGTWLYTDGAEWTISKVRNVTNDFMILGFPFKDIVAPINSIALPYNVGQGYDKDFKLQTRPVFYLKDRLFIDSGNGKKDNPYIITTTYRGCIEGQNFSDCIIDQYTEDGINNLYLHDGIGDYENSEYEIGDNSYRYAGEDAKNFVCFNGDDCTDIDNIYQVIGVIDGRVKLMKYDSIGDMAWDEDGGLDWTKSSLNNYLNGEYLDSLGNKEKYIDTNNWHVNVVDTELEAESVYDMENNYTELYSAKIGLIYIYDWIYNFKPSYWDPFGTLDNYAHYYEWMMLWKPFYTITSEEEYESVYHINYDGWFDATPLADLSIYPSFYLKSNVKYISGSGSELNPYIIG